MKKFYNNNERYGDCGPFQAETREALADEMADTFEQWANEEYDRNEEQGNGEEFKKQAIAKMRSEFISGLDEVA